MPVLFSFLRVPAQTLPVLNFLLSYMHYDEMTQMVASVFWAVLFFEYISPVGKDKFSEIVSFDEDS